MATVLRIGANILIRLREKMEVQLFNGFAVLNGEKDTRDYTPYYV